MAKRKPGNMLTLSKKPSLKRSPVLAEAEKKVKEKKAKERAASRASAKKGNKPAPKKPAGKKTDAPAGKKPSVKKPTANKPAGGKKPSKKGAVPKVRKDPMWKHLAAAFRKQVKKEEV